MNLTDKYLILVGKYLPNSIKKDIIDELRSSIEDEKDMGRSEKEIIESLGNPREVAQRYHSNLKYLIGPDLRDIYFKVLIFTSLAVSIGLTIAHLISLTFGNLTVLGFFFGLISSLPMALISSFGSVTIIFFLVNRYALEQIVTKREKAPWNISELEKVQKNEKSFEYAELIIGIFFYILAIIFFNFLLDKMSFPLINFNHFKKYTLILSLIWSMQAFLNLLLIMRGHWSILHRFVKIMLEIGSAIVIINLVMHPDFFNQAGLVAVENINSTLQFIVMQFPKFIVVVTIIGLISTIAKHFRQSLS